MGNVSITPRPAGNPGNNKKRKDNKMTTQYTLSKTVLAKPLTRKAYNDLRGWMLPNDEDGNDEGFLVEDINGKPNVTGYNGYISWLPAEEFKRTCKPK